MGKNGKDRRNELWRMIRDGGWDKEFGTTVKAYQHASAEDMEEFLATKAESEIQSMLTDDDAPDDAPSVALVAPDKDKVKHYDDMYSNNPVLCSAMSVNTDIDDILSDAVAEAENKEFVPAPDDAIATQYTEDTPANASYIAMMKDMDMPCPVCHLRMVLDEVKGVWVCSTCGENPSFEKLGISPEEVEEKQKQAMKSMGGRLGPSEGSVANQVKALSPEELQAMLGNFKNALPDDMITGTGDAGQPPVQADAVVGAGKPRTEAGFISDKDKIGTGAVSDKGEEFGIRPLSPPDMKPKMVTGKKGMVKRPVNYETFINPNAPPGSRNPVTRGNRGHRTVSEQDEKRGLKPLPSALYNDGRHGPKNVVSKVHHTVANNTKHRRAVGAGGNQTPLRPEKTIVDQHGKVMPLPPPPPDWEGPVKQDDRYAREPEPPVRGGPPQRKEWTHGDYVQRQNITSEVRNGAGGNGQRRPRKARGRKIIRH